MPFSTDGGVHETVDGATTSFTTQESDDAIYVRKADGSTPETDDVDSPDDVDPRKLMSDPHVNDIRWLARTSFGGTIVTKPIDDAFKHGFEVKDADNAATLLDDLGWEETYRRAQKKARRDGFALVFAVMEDDSDGVHTDPLSDSITVNEIQNLQVLTIDDMSKRHGTTTVPNMQVADEFPFDDDDMFEIRDTGIVIDKDPTSPTYKDPLGYLVGQDRPRRGDQIRFIHRNRIVHHLTWNDWVDGDLDSDTLGRWEGDSVLTSSYHILKGIKKGNWSIMQTVFRYAAKLYHVELPEDANEEDKDQAFENIKNMNSMSELVTPAGYEINDYQTDGQLEPQEYFDVLFDQVCASNEMTKSVLFGTQTGTVSGSETDIKNYFNKVERMRREIITADMHEFVSNVVSLVDGRASEDFAADFEIEWGPLFKLTELDNAETLSRKMQTLSAAVNNFIMTPQEARSILQEEWAEVDIDWNENFTTEEQEWLRTLNVAQLGTEATLPEDMEFEGSTQQQNGGGRVQGETSDPDSPTTDALSGRDVDRIADQVAQKLQ